jgi:hypothetical protein
MAGPIAVRGLADVQRAFARADKESRAGVRNEMSSIAEPVQMTVETLASSTIRNIGPLWPVMRIGVTRKLVYVAPKQRGVKVKGGTSRSRRKFAPLLAARALEPAQAQHEGQFEAQVEQMLDRIADGFNRGGERL